jgi:hypothetical protein
MFTFFNSSVILTFTVFLKYRVVYLKFGVKEGNLPPPKGGGKVVVSRFGRGKAQINIQ